jgi:hypothetical protein
MSGRDFSYPHPAQAQKSLLPPFHPLTVLRDWSPAAPGAAFRIVDSQTHCAAVGATGSGKSSGPLRHLSLAFLAHNYSICALSSKNETPTWEAWAEETARWDRRTQSGDLVIFGTSGKYRFNLLEWEAKRAASQGAGLTINIVNLLDEIAGAIVGNSARGHDGGGPTASGSKTHCM